MMAAVYTSEYTEVLVERLHTMIARQTGVKVAVFSGLVVNYQKEIALFVLGNFYSYQKQHVANFYGVNINQMDAIMKKNEKVYVRSAFFRKMIHEIIDYCDNGR